MSEYGRLYEKAAEIRQQLKAELPNSLTGNYTPDDVKRIAREKAASFVKRIDSLANEWAELEEEMKRTPG